MSMKDICWAAYNSVPPGMEHGLEAVSYYDPPNMTYPFGAYICVMDIDVDTGVYKVRRFYALDDCGTRINPMIIDGQVHGGLTEAFAIAMGQEIRYDETGNVVTGSVMDFSLPRAGATQHSEPALTGAATPQSPHRPTETRRRGGAEDEGLSRRRRYEGQDKAPALNEGTYEPRRLPVRAGRAKDGAEIEDQIFTEKSLREGPLRAVTRHPKPPVLLIDEV